MIEILQNIWGFVQTAFDFLSNMAQSMFITFSVLSSSLTFPQWIASFMPLFLTSSVTIVVALTVAKFVIGR